MTLNGHFGVIVSRANNLRFTLRGLDVQVRMATALVLLRIFDLFFDQLKLDLDLIFLVLKLLDSGS